MVHSTKIVYLLLSLLLTVSACHSVSSKKEKKDETDSIQEQKEVPALEHSEDSIFEDDTVSHQRIPCQIVIAPVPRDIPVGKAIHPDSLSMHTEYDYYPLSATEVKIIITNHSHHEYDCGEGYSLTYYNEQRKVWEPLPTNPIINDVAWIFPPEFPLIYRLSGFIHPKCPIVRANTAFIKHSTDTRK